MRRRVLVSMFAALFVLSLPMRSETQTPAANPLDQLAWMIGGTWTADGEKGPDGKPFHVETKFDWAENHRGLKFTTWFMVDEKLTPVYTGLYAWHPAKKKFTFLYTDNEGNMTEGDAVLTGDQLEQEFQIVWTNGKAQTFRSTVVHSAPDVYDWNVRQQNKEGHWEVMFGLKYRRKPA